MQQNNNSGAMRRVSYALVQNDTNFTLRQSFDCDGTNEEIIVFITESINKFFRQCKRYKMKTQFKFSKKFFVAINVDGTNYNSLDLVDEIYDGVDRVRPLCTITGRTNKTTGELIVNDIVFSNVVADTLS
jgi:hypothetical protein